MEGKCIEAEMEGFDFLVTFQFCTTYFIKVIKLKNKYVNYWGGRKLPREDKEMQLETRRKASILSIFFFFGCETAREFCFISLIKYEIKIMNIGVIIVSSLFLYLCTLKNNI